MRTPNIVLRSIAVLSLLIAGAGGLASTASAQASQPRPGAAVSNDCAAHVAKQLPASMAKADVASAISHVCNVTVAHGVSKVSHKKSAGAVTPDGVGDTSSTWATLTGEGWQIEIDWAYEQVDDGRGHIGFTPVGVPNCHVNWSYGITVSQRQPTCYWYGQIPAWSGGDPNRPNAFGTDDQITVSWFFKGFPVSADHALYVATNCYGENHHSSY